MWFVAPVMFLASFAACGEEALVTGYHLKPASAAVKVGGTVKLDLVYCQVMEKKPGNKPKAESGSKPRGKYYGEGVSDDELAPLVESKPSSNGKSKGKYYGEKVPDGELAPLHVLKLVCDGDDGYDVLAPLVLPDVKWEVVDGQGRVSGDRNGATYRAPASRPTSNKATVAVSYTMGKEKTILFSKITILDEVKTYAGTFSSHDVSVNTEYTRNLTGKIRWELDEYYEEGGWREYTGSGTATLKVSRTGCGTAANFADVPVEGRLKVYDDKNYEFLINLVGDKEQTRTCRRPELSKDLSWEETFSSGGDAVSSGDPCGTSEFYPRYSDVTSLAFERKGGCNNVTNRFEERWSFEAVE